jgi:hypothetical protein
VEGEGADGGGRKQHFPLFFFIASQTRRTGAACARKAIAGQRACIALHGRRPSRKKMLCHQAAKHSLSVWLLPVNRTVENRICTRRERLDVGGLRAMASAQPWMSSPSA